MKLDEATTAISNSSIMGKSIEYQNGFIAMRDRAMKYLNQVDETNRILVPRCALDWLETYDEACDLIKLYADIEYSTGSDGFVEAKWPHSPDFYDWLVDDEEKIYILADALRHGYEVEKEPLYYVKLPIFQWDCSASGLIEEEMYLGFSVTSDETRFFRGTYDYKKGGYKFDLTKEQIMDIDERYWAFAVPVEEESKC